MPEKPNESAGWYPSPDGPLRWWDGESWGPEAPTSPENSAGDERVIPASPKPGLAALVLSIVLAPVGLVLGVVSLMKAKRSGEPRPTLGFIATIIGSAGTLAIVLAIFGVVVVTGLTSDSQRADAFCQSAASDPTLTDDLLGLVTPLNEISPPFIPGKGPTDEEKLAIADQIASLSSRFPFLTSSGQGYRDVWNSGTDLWIYLGEVESALRSETASDSSLDMNAGGNLERLVSIYANDLSKQCNRR